MVTITHFYIKLLAERFHRFQVHILKWRGILGVAMQQYQVLFRKTILIQGLNRSTYILHIAHTGTEDGLLVVGGNPLQEWIVGHFTGRNLPQAQVQGMQILNTVKVKSSGEKLDAFLLAIGNQHFVVFRRQFQLLQHLVLAVTALTNVLLLILCLFGRFGHKLGGFEGLELDIVHTRLNGLVNQLLGQCQRTVMVHPCFCYDNGMFCHFDLVFSMAGLPA